MKKLHLLHEEPLRFAKYVVSLDENEAVVRNEFGYIPTLSMLIEGAAQSSAAFSEDDDDKRMGYLTSLRNIKLLSKPTSKGCDMKISLTSKINDIGCFSFEAIEDDTVLASGSFVVVSQ